MAVLPTESYLIMSQVIQAQTPTERPVALLPTLDRPEPRLRHANWQDGIAQSQEVSQAFPSGHQDDSFNAATASNEQIQPSNGPAGMDAKQPAEIVKSGSIEIDIDLGDLGSKPAPPGQDEEYIGSLFDPVLFPAVGKQQGRGAAAVAGEDLVDLMEGIDDDDEIARTGLWTPRD